MKKLKAIGATVLVVLLSIAVIKFTGKVFPSTKSWPFVGVVFS